MSMPVPQKIVLKNSTNMSLNERFSKINKVRPPTAQTVTLNMANQHQASIKQGRLAQQMANRNQNYPTNEQFKPPIKSRLGITARLGFKRGFGPRRGRQSIGNAIIQEYYGFTPTRGGTKIGRGGPYRYGYVMRRQSGRPTTTFNIYNSSTANRRPWGNRGGRGNGRGGRNQNQATVKTEVTKDQLDTELDAYMSHTN